MTTWAFLSQVLDDDPACRKAVARVSAHLSAGGRSPCSEDTSAYCQARRRLPPGLLPRLTRQSADRLEDRVPDEQLWRGRRVRIVDGSSISMPDTPANRAAYSIAWSQKPGCGFPVARIAALFSWATGSVLDAALDTLHVHERLLFHRIWGRLQPGDVLLNDRGFCSYGNMVCLKKRNIDIVSRVVQMKIIDFRRGVRLGPDDHLVAWQKGPVRPCWLSREEFDALPDEITLREIRFRIDIPGFRTREIVLVTTLLDPVEYPKEALAALYRDRWLCETDLKHLKDTMKMGILRGRSPDIVCKEFWAHLLGYNLLRSLMWSAAQQERVPLRRLSVKGTLQRLDVFTPLLIQAAPSEQHRLLARLMEDIAADLVPLRPDRFEPRAVKRRPKAYPLLTRPRAEAKRRLAC